MSILAGCGSPAASVSHTSNGSPMASASSSSTLGAVTSTPSPSVRVTGLSPWPRATNLVYDSSHHQVLLFGGSVSGGAQDTWAWDGSAWSLLHPSSSPPVRQGAALADDPGHQVVVLFGGDNVGNVRGDTWLWDGSNWSPASPLHSPSPRTGAALTYDAARHVVLLFGGQASGGMTLNDTWIWTGSDWIEQPTDNAPPARAYGRLAFDAADGVTILFGGDVLGLDDTWKWDGATWTQLHPSNTPPGWNTATRYPQPMVYDAARQVVMFVGPQHHSSLTSDDSMETWTWNGTTWTHQTPAHVPPVRDGIGLAFDAQRGVTVMAGGWSINGDATSTWGWNGTDWTKLSD